jgi:hypothetical protein
VIELHLGSGRPGAEQSAEALEQAWLQVREPSPGSAPSLSELVLILDLGEAEAILLAEEVDCRFLLSDERMDLRSALARYLSEDTPTKSQGTCRREGARAKPVQPLEEDVLSTGQNLKDHSGHLSRGLWSHARKTPTKTVNRPAGR